jgi:hypothetical protein
LSPLLYSIVVLFGPGIMICGGGARMAKPVTDVGVMLFAVI